MKKQFGFVMTVLAILFMGAVSQAAPQNGNYRCKNTASGVCAQSLKSGQCTHEWTQDDHNDPMFHCKKFIGIKVSNYDPKNYYCKQMGDSVCAASKKHGGCGHVWSYDHGTDAMWQCRKHLGLVSSSFDKSKFRCKKTSSGACAQSTKTGQCTHEWSKDDHHNPMFVCQQWLKR